MSNYKLTIQISTADLYQIHCCNQRVIIVKEVGGSSGTPVSWVSLNPFETNSIT